MAGVVVIVEVHAPGALFVQFQKPHHEILNRTHGSGVRQHSAQACLWCVSSRHDAWDMLAHPIKLQQEKVVVRTM